MSKYRLRVPVMAWMDVGVVEAEDFDDALDKSYQNGTDEYPKLCECCAKKFDLGEPDETGTDAYLDENNP